MDYTRWLAASLEDIPRVCRRAWTTVANSVAVRRTHIWQRRYQSRSDDWLYRSLRRYVLRGGKSEHAPETERERETVSDREEERVREAMRVENRGREKRTRGVSRSPPDKLSDAKRLLRGGIIHQTLFSLSLSASLPPAFPSSLSLPLSVSFRPSTLVFLHPRSAAALSLLRPYPASCCERRWEAAEGFLWSVIRDARDIPRCFYYY